MFNRASLQSEASRATGNEREAVRFSNAPRVGEASNEPPPAIAASATARALGTVPQAELHHLYL